MRIKLSEKKSSKVRIFRLLAVILVVVLSVQFGAGFFEPPVSASTASRQLEEAKEKQAELNKQKEALAEQNEQLEGNVDELTGQLSWLNERSDEQKALYQEKMLQLEAAIAEMEQAYLDYLQAEENLAGKQEQYAERIQVMFAYQQKSLLEIFLESNSLQGFFTTLQFMSIVADTDQQMIDELAAARDHAEVLKAIAIQTATDMEIVVAQLEADIEKLKSDVEATAEDLEQAQLMLSEREMEELALVEESDELAEEIRQLTQTVANEKATAAAEATRAAQSSTVSSAGWYWPYPSDHTIYSPYGMRYHPIYHYYRMHTGVDLGGTFGYPIVAAKSGTVVLVRNYYEGRNYGGSGYGNYIVIDHGGGYTTLYGHLKNTLVRVGQTVNAGDKIATCGSTGTSTGPHLHFEIRINGSTVDPAKYIK